MFENFRVFETEFAGRKMTFETGKMCCQAQWPKFDASKTVAATVEMAVQVNGKLKGRIVISVGAAQDTVLAQACADERVSAALEGKTVVKQIYVKDKLVNFVVR